MAFNQGRLWNWKIVSVKGSRKLSLRLSVAEEPDR